MRKIILGLCSLCTAFSFAQTLNDYEYVSISEKYNFQRTPDEYQLNRLLKCQLEEYGFKVLYTTDLIHVQESDRCYVLNATVIPKSNIFLYKFIIEFTDCNNSIIYQSEIGGSSEKDLHDAFTAALDGALKSVKLVNYKYEGTKRNLIFNYENEQVSPTANVIYKEGSNLTNDSIASSVNTIALVEQPKVVNPSVVKGGIEQTNTNPKKPVATQAKATPKKNSAVAKTNVALEKPALANPIENNSNLEKSVVEVKSTPMENETLEGEKNSSLSGILLYAQAIDNGYQLIDTTPKVILKISNTLQANYYEANIDTKYGAVFMKNDQWVFEYFLDGKLISEPLTIKFCD